MVSEIIKRIESRKAVVGIIGLGYVGLPLLIGFAKKNFSVIGFDIDESKVNRLKEGISYIKHISEQAIREIFLEHSSDTTTDFSRVAECDCILICVPTPLTKNRDPDLSYIENTCHQIAPYIKRNQFVSLESTTYPGTTEDILAPILEKTSGLKAGTDFFIAFSPEREDPNNPDFTTANIPKVIGAMGEDSRKIAIALYGSVIQSTVPVSDCRTAEATKLMENIFRSVNIALVNELKVVFTEMGINIWEVIRAASTKPFGFMPFYPGPGLGGHCIPIDPFYLTWKAREFDVTTRFIELAGEINTSMPKYVVERTMIALNKQGKALKNSKVLLVGLAYKKNVDDDRESPTFVLWKEFNRYGSQIAYYDPYLPEIRPSREHSDLASIKSVLWEDIPGAGFDVAVIATAHDCVNHDKIVEMLPLVVDTRGVCRCSEKVFQA